MRSLWWRWIRLLGESRIRLDSRELRFDVIVPGDRLQIGPRLWRVERRHEADASLELAPVEPAADPGRRPRLSFAGGDAFCPWTFEDGGNRVRLASRDVLHFPVAAVRSL